MHSTNLVKFVKLVVDEPARGRRHRALHRHRRVEPPHLGVLRGSILYAFTFVKVTTKTGSSRKADQFFKLERECHPKASGDIELRLRSAASGLERFLNAFVTKSILFSQCYQSLVNGFQQNESVVV